MRWFAADADGHVASFSPARVGAIPDAAITGVYDAAFWDELDRVARRRPLPRPVLDPDREFARHLESGLVDGGSPDQIRHQARDAADGTALVFLRSADDARLCGIADPRPATRGVSGLVAGSELGRIHAAGLCEGCFTADAQAGRVSVSDILIEYREAPVDGAAHLVAGIYVMTAPPMEPLTLRECSLNLRILLGSLRLRVPCFFDMPAIQPVELGLCKPTDAIAYVTTRQDEIRPLEGRLGAYEEHLRRMAAQLPAPVAAMLWSPPKPGPGAQPLEF